MRLTRAAIRAQAHDGPDAISIHEDTDVDTSRDQITQEEDPSRPILKDITEDNCSTTTEEVAELKQSIRGKKCKGSKKKEKQMYADIDEAPAVTDAAAEHPTECGESGDQQTELNEQHVEALETLAPADSPASRISETEEMTTDTPEKVVAITSKTSKFDPTSHTVEDEPPADIVKDDSFVGSIKTRSPIKLSREPSRDSFLESIKSRSPARRTSRLEDSVEAMDALEDAIEEISIKLPQIEHIEIQSPVREKQSPPKALPPTARKTALDIKDVPRTPKATKESQTKTKPAQLKQGPPRTKSGHVSTSKPMNKGPIVNKSTSRPTTVVPKPTTTGVVSKTMSSNSSHKTESNLAKKRVTSGPLFDQQTGLRSSEICKATDKVYLRTPGEAIAAKMKAQREERAKQQEEEKNKTAFKARPAPSKASRPSVMPRENKASLARKSSAPTVDGQIENKENVAPKGSLRTRPSVATAANTKNLDVKKRRTEESAAVRANSSVRRTTSFTPPTEVTKRHFPTTRPSIAPKPVARPSVAPRVASLTKAAKLSPSPDHQQRATVKLSGKEVYARTKLGRDKEEKEKREKEEAAKKARAEASERGRQASREWAEKQKRKMEMRKAASTASPSVAAVEVS